MKEGKYKPVSKGNKTILGISVKGGQGGATKARGSRGKMKEFP